MGLGIRWALVILFVAYGLSALAAVEDFNQIICEDTQAQNQLAREIQIHLGISKEKIDADIQAPLQTDSVALENSNLKFLESE